MSTYKRSSSKASVESSEDKNTKIFPLIVLSVVTILFLAKNFTKFHITFVVKLEKPGENDKR